LLGQIKALALRAGRPVASPHQRLEGAAAGPADEIVERHASSPLLSGAENGSSLRRQGNT